MFFGQDEKTLKTDIAFQGRLHLLWRPVRSPAKSLAVPAGYGASSRVKNFSGVFVSRPWFTNIMVKKICLYLHLRYSGVQS